MASSVYVTFDDINQHTGAGKVCHHEVNALREVTDLKQVISKKEVSQKIYRFYGFNPFLFDYFASDLLRHRDVDFAHLSCSPGMSILNKLRPKKYCVNVVAHDLKTSIDEHERMYGGGHPYPFHHNTDEYLHDCLLKHAKSADIVFTPSRNSEKWIKENINPPRIEIVHHGVDYPETLPRSSKDFNVGYIGAWGPDKGVYYLVKAWSDLNYHDSILYFFGHGTREMRETLVAWAGDGGGKYHLAGGFNHLSDIMPRFSVYVQPSVSEGYGMTMPEAMSYGKAVVVSEGVGSVDLIKDGENGLIVPIRNPKAIAEAIQYFRDNPSEIKRMGKNARETAEECRWENIERRYEEIYVSASV